MSRSISQNTMTRVLDVIKQEADMDGVVTTTDVFVSEKVSLDPITVFHAVHALIDSGQLIQHGKVGQFGVRLLEVKDYQ
jgi:hypothetical protein